MKGFFKSRLVLTLVMLVLVVGVTIVTLMPGLRQLRPHSAKAASADRVLILAGTVTGGSSSIEASEATADGLAVDVVDATTWSSMTAAQFASYRAIILGDPTCSGITPDIDAAAANAKVWGPTINGNIVILGTDPVYHATQGGETVTRRGVDFAVNQVGKTGAYITLSCYYHGTAPNTPVPLLDGIGAGGFTVTGVGCYNNAHIVAESPALSGLTDANLSNWSCSVHEAFQKWPGQLIPLAIARDFDSSFTASDGSQGPPYILAGGDIKSFPLSLSPLSDSAVAGESHTVTAQLLDASTRAPVNGAAIVFSVVAGPNAGAKGSCSPISFICATNTLGKVSWMYQSNGSAGDDVIQAFYDKNGNGHADTGEPLTTAGMNWTKPTLPQCTFGRWSTDHSKVNVFYHYGGGHRYQGNAYQGGMNWTNTGTNVTISAGSGVPVLIDVPLSDISSRNMWWAATTWNTNGETITSASIAYNQRTMDPLGDFMRTKVATHEFGHSIGLEHPVDCGQGKTVRSVMNQGVLLYNIPQPRDIDLVKRLYL